jgi:proline iminopeptidase
LPSKTVIYPKIDAYEYGQLDVGDGHGVYWEQCGNPKGKPVVVLHGGPGSGCTESMRRLFDPAVYRIILFDQRGCGRSTPHGSETLLALEHNTTQDLIGDIERLRKHLKIRKWMVFGMSWGCTLGLAYAEQNRRRVSDMVLIGVTTTTPAEIDWLYRGAAVQHPDEWRRFCQGVVHVSDDMVEAYYRLVQHPVPAVCMSSAKRWFEWEWSLTATNPEALPEPRRLTPRFQLGWARIVTHYFYHDAWLEDGQILANIGQLARIPCTMIHGAEDLSAPLHTAEALSAAWPKAELVVVNGAGHSASDDGMTEATIAATDNFTGAH